MASSSTHMTVLSAEKRQLFQRLLRERGIASTNNATIPRCSRTQPIPLSSAQQRMWFLDQLAPGDSAYNDCYAIRFSGELGVAVLEQALNEVVRRHESLRTTFGSLEGRPIQVINPVEGLKLPVLDLQQEAETDRDAEIQRWAIEESKQPFALARCPLFRVKLMRLDADDHVLLLVIHHMIFDGQSFLVFFQELGAVYEAFRLGQTSPLPELDVQYADYAAWEQGRLDGEAMLTQLSYWKQQLEGRLSMSELPTDFPRQDVQTFRGTGKDLKLPKPLTEALAALGNREDATLFMVLLSAFRIVVCHYTSWEEILLGFPVANRSQPEAKGLIGLFVNTLPLRADLSGDPSFRDLVARTRKACLGAYAHQELPLEMLVKELKLDRDLSRNPLFQMWVLQDTVCQPIELPALTMRHLTVEYGVTRFDLDLWIIEHAAGRRAQAQSEELVLRLQYNTDLFRAATIAKMLHHLEVVLRHAVSDPDVTLSMLKETLTAADKREQLIERRDRKLGGSKMLKNIRRKSIRRQPI